MNGRKLAKEKKIQHFLSIFFIPLRLKNKVMSDINSITAPIAEELKRFNVLLNEELKAQTNPLDAILKHVLKAKGKQLRPILILLSAKLFGAVNAKTYHTAIFTEMVHTATLIHDDVIDEAKLRRGIPAVHTMWDNRSAVLAGDYLLSKAVKSLSQNAYYDILSEVLRTACIMSEGELMQSDKAQRLDINESDYFEIIACKTASLMEMCCRTGAMSTNATANEAEMMALYGQHLGLAFQIRDDIFDFLPSKDLGKPAGTDIRERNFTLPLIYCLDKANETERKQLLSDIQNVQDDDSLLSSIVERVIKSGGIAYAESRMQEHIQLALQQLHGLPQNGITEALTQLAHYCAERKS